MLISHEVPKSLLEESLKFNDYDYFLIHLYEKYDEYKNFYNKCKKLNRKIILDNSACELRNKKEFDFDKYADYVEQLKPNEYLIPDVFNDYEKNIEYFDKWMKLYSKLPGIKIATLHGKREEDLINAYLYFNRYDVKIAINFDEIIYTKYNLCESNINMNKMLNRIQFIHKLIYYGIIDENVKHHILGCHLPQEFKTYKKYKWIETIDTSNPVMAAFDELPYTINGILGKPKSNIDTVQNIEIDERMKQRIKQNVTIFRNFIKD